MDDAIEAVDISKPIQILQPTYGKKATNGWPQS
jgi:hypothetical protein